MLKQHISFGWTSECLLTQNTVRGFYLIPNIEIVINLDTVAWNDHASSQKCAFIFEPGNVLLEKKDIKNQMSIKIVD